MIQINLLPDVKLKFLKTQRNKKLIFTIAAITSAGFIALVVLLALHVYVNQAFHRSRLQSDIDSKISEYTSIENLDTILTVREQLIELPFLHSSKPAATRIPDFLAKLVPSDIKIGELSVDYINSEIRLSGRGENTKAVNRFADILKNATFTSGDGTTPNGVFTDVEFDIGVQGDDDLSFDAQMSFDSTIFNISNDSIEISVPNITSTQSFIRSSSLFDQIDPTKGEEQ